MINKHLVLFVSMRMQSYYAYSICNTLIPICGNIKKGKQKYNLIIKVFSLSITRDEPL